MCSLLQFVSKCVASVMVFIYYICDTNIKLQE